jgi:CHASE2 domain-containing sensor protein
MKIRAFILLVLVGAAVGFSFRGEARAKMREFNLLFLDFLNANTRSQLDKDPLPAGDEVVFVEFREADKKEYSAWPPTPLDYIMALKRLAGHDPEVVAFSDVLKWEKPDVQFVGELQQAFLNFPAVVLAFDAQEIGAEAVDSVIREEVNLPAIATVVGDAKLAPRLGKYVFPAKTLRTQMQLGFVLPPKKEVSAVPLVARSGEALTPSLAAQILALKEHAPYASQRLRFGRGAGLYLGGEVFVPLKEDGTVTPKLSGDVTRVNALDLMTPSLPDAAAQAAEARLGKHKVVIIGVVPSGGEEQARAVAWALALPKLHRAPDMVEWIAVGMAALLGLWQLRFRRFGAVVFGVGVTAVMLAIALTEFQTAHWWCPAALPGGITALATVFCFLWPRSHKAAPPPAAVAETPAAEAPA